LSSLATGSLLETKSLSFQNTEDFSLDTLYSIHSFIAERVSILDIETIGAVRWPQPIETKPAFETKQNLSPIITTRGVDVASCHPTFFISLEDSHKPEILK
jgi:hypothetical protein